MTDQLNIRPLKPEADLADAMHEFIIYVTAPAGATYAKLADAVVPGYQAEFDPAEAETAGAFAEDALSEADALASTQDADA